MSVSLMGTQGPTRAWTLFSHFSGRERRCELVGINYSPTITREKERAHSGGCCLSDGPCQERNSPGAVPC